MSLGPPTAQEGRQLGLRLTDQQRHDSSWHQQWKRFTITACGAVHTYVHTLTQPSSSKLESLSNYPLYFHVRFVRKVG